MCWVTLNKIPTHPVSLSNSQHVNFFFFIKREYTWLFCSCGRCCWISSMDKWVTKPCLHTFYSDTHTSPQLPPQGSLAPSFPQGRGPSLFHHSVHSYGGYPCFLVPCFLFCMLFLFPVFVLCSFVLFLVIIILYLVIFCIVFRYDIL